MKFLRVWGFGGFGGFGGLGVWGFINLSFGLWVEGFGVSGFRLWGSNCLASIVTSILA